MSNYILILGVCGVKVIIIGNGHSDLSSNPGEGYFASCYYP